MQENVIVNTNNNCFDEDRNNIIKLYISCIVPLKTEPINKLIKVNMP